MKGADVSPPEIHPVVADMAAAVEIWTNHAADPAADGQLGLQGRMANRRDVLVYVEIIGDYLFLTGRIGLGNLSRLQRIVHRMRDFARAIHRRGKSEHLVNDVHV